MSLVVEKDFSGYAVFHKPSGLRATPALRQRRFANEALSDLIATGVDFTQDARAISGTREEWRAVYEKWMNRGKAEGFDKETGEYYPVGSRYGTFIPSAKWAAAWREARANGDVERLGELISKGNKAVATPKGE